MTLDFPSAVLTAAHVLLGLAMLFALVRLVRGPSAVQRVFEVSGLEPRLPFVDDVEAGAGSDD